MADFSLTNTSNNPSDWFIENYSYDNTGTTDTITIDLTSALTSTGVVDADLHATTGDVRSVYLAVAEALFKAYDGKDASAATTSGRLKMTKSQSFQNIAPSDPDFNQSEDIRYTTYTIHVQEEGTMGNPYFISTGVRAE